MWLLIILCYTCSHFSNVSLLFIIIPSSVLPSHTHIDTHSSVNTHGLYLETYAHT